MKPSWPTPTHLHPILKKIQCLILDVDGIMTDGTIEYRPSGEHSKRFHVQDGYGIQRLSQSGVVIALISGKSSPCVTRRAQELGLIHVYQGITDKLTTFKKLAQTLGISADHCAFAGDDIQDQQLMQHVALAITVPNGVPEILATAQWQTQRAGGHGAVREICDVLRAAREA